MDEIQLVKNWELFVDRLLRNSNYRVIVTGSSSHLLSQEIATEMRGRSIRWELFPFSFSEYLQALNIDTKLQTSKKKAQRLLAADKFLIEGGFPETINRDRSLQIKILQEYYNSILFKDVIERHNISQPLAAKSILKLLINQNSSLFTVNKLFERIKALNFHVHKSFAGEILAALEDAYALFTVPVFSESVHRQQVNPKKVYSIDNRLMLVQVCADLSDSETLERELVALKEAQDENPEAKCLIVTRTPLKSEIEGFAVMSLTEFLMLNPTEIK